MIDARGFLRAVTHRVQRQDDSDGRAARPIRLGTVDPGYVSGDPRVLLDGNTVMTNKTYKTVGYTPVANDRVVCVPVGKRNYVITGKVGSFDTGGGGTPGPAGRGIADAAVDASGNLTLSMTDSTVEGPWNVKGPKGDTGAQGPEGPAGASNLPVLKLRRGPTTQYIGPIGAGTDINWDGPAERDPLGMWSAGSPSLITVPSGQGGFYVGVLAIVFNGKTADPGKAPNPTTAAALGGYVLLNGTQTAVHAKAAIEPVPASGTQTCFQVSIAEPLAAGDVLRCRVYGGGNVSFNSYLLPNIYGGVTFSLYKIST